MDKDEQNNTPQVELKACPHCEGPITLTVDCAVEAALQSRTNPAPDADAVERALVTALGEAAFTFETYEKLHAAKGTPDGYAKAQANAKAAKRCRDAIALASHPAPVSGGGEDVCKDCGGSGYAAPGDHPHSCDSCNGTGKAASEELIERLMRLVMAPVFKLGKHEGWQLALANPDGPAAAEAIKELQAEVERQRAAASHWFETSNREHNEYEKALRAAEAKAEALAAIVREIPISGMVGKCGWRTWEQARDGIAQALIQKEEGK